MAMVKNTKTGKVELRPVKENSETSKVTDSIRKRLQGNYSGRDINRDYWLHQKKKT